MFVISLVQSYDLICLTFSGQCFSLSLMFKEISVMILFLKANIFRLFIHNKTLNKSLINTNMINFVSEFFTMYNFLIRAYLLC